MTSLRLPHILIVLLVIFATPMTQATAQASSTPAFPNFSLSELEGASWELAGQPSTPKLIMFWATWCPHCKEFFPTLQSWHEEHAPELSVVAISVFDTGDVSAYRNRYELSMTILVNGDNLAKRLNIPGTPTVVLLDEQNQIVYATVNPAADALNLIAAIHSVLGIEAPQDEYAFQ